MAPNVRLEPCGAATSSHRTVDRGGSKRLSASLGMLAPVLYCERPPLVIAPTTTNLEVSWRKAFLSKPESANQFARSRIARLYVCFDPMQPMDSKHFPEHRP